MRVIMAETSGFCNGVRRAMRIALESAVRHGGLQADGPLVHNRTALELLALHGVGSAPDGGESAGPVLVRAHGATTEQRRLWSERGLDVIDATCPHVAHNQKTAVAAAERGRAVVIAGDPDHAEVRAVSGCVPGGCAVVSDVADIGRLDTSRPVFMLAQTTFNAREFGRMAAALRERFPGAEVRDTICRATHDRQREARRLAGLADAVVVVGGKNSANTRRLAEAAEREGKPAFLVETAADLDPRDFRGFLSVGVISGASTPGWLMQETVNRLRRMGGDTPASWLRGLLVPLVEARFTTAASAAGLALAAWYGLTDGFSPAMAAAGAGFVFFAHTLNRRVPSNARARRLSFVDAFYQARRPGLLTLAWLGAATALCAPAWAGGAPAFGLFAAMVAATVVYAGLVRRREAESGGMSPPLSARNLVMAAGWSLALAGPPALEAGFSAGGAGALAFVFLLCCGGTIVRDLLDIMSDRLMGIGTLAASLGPPFARRLAGTALALAAALPLAVAVAHLPGGQTPGPRYVFMILLPLAPGIGLYLLETLREGRIRDAVVLQAGVDAMGCLAGVLALLCGGIDW